MIDFGPLDELREIRRRLSEQCGNDMERYAAMLADVSTRIPGEYVTLPTSSALQPRVETVQPVSSPAVAPTPPEIRAS